MWVFRTPLATTQRVRMLWAVPVLASLAGCATAPEREIVRPECSLPALVYPAQSRRLGEMGVVEVRTELDTEGRVIAARVLRSSGMIRLDDAAVEAMRAVRCSPALDKRTGDPVAYAFEQAIRFRLD